MGVGVGARCSPFRSRHRAYASKFREKKLFSPLERTSVSLCLHSIKESETATERDLRSRLQSDKYPMPSECQTTRYSQVCIQYVRKKHKPSVCPYNRSCGLRLITFAMKRATCMYSLPNTLLGLHIVIQTLAIAYGES